MHISDEVADIIRGFDNAHSRFQRELVELAQAKGFRDLSDWERVTRYLDFGGRPDLVTGKGRFVELFDSGTIYQNAKRQLLRDTRKNPAMEALQAERAEKAREQLVETFQKTVAAEGLTLEKELLEGLNEVIRKLSDDGVEALQKVLTDSGADLADLGLSKAMVSLSRSFVASNTAGRLSGPMQALLYIQTRKYLEDASSFKVFMNKLGKFTSGRLGGANSTYRKAPRPGADSTAFAKSYGFAGSAMGLAAAIGYSARRYERLHMGRLGPEVAQDVNFLLSGQPGRVKNLEEASEALYRMGVSILTDHGVVNAKDRVGQLHKTAKLLLEVGTSKGDESVFMPKQLIDLFETQAGDIIKSIDAVTVRPLSGPVETVADWTIQLYKAQMSLWRASVVTGLFVPNPRYWVNNIIGDAGQMLQEVGLGFALKRTVANLPANMPYANKISVWKAKQMERATRSRFGDVPVLPGILESVLDPVLGKIFRGADGVIQTAQGNPISYGQVRRWALEDGIMEDFVHEELLQTMKMGDETFLRSILEPGKNLNRAIADHAGVVQQRQRLGMYLELLLDGSPRAVAKERTLRALYDWKHGIAQRELDQMKYISTFYRFWRLALRQTTGALLDPLTLAPSKYLRQEFSLRGTPYRRMRATILLAGHTSDLVDPQFQTDLHEYALANPEVTRALIANMNDERAVFGINEMTEAERREYEIETGTTASHYYRSTPPITSVGAMKMTIGFISTAQGVAGKVLGILPESEYLPPAQLVSDWEARAMEPALQALAPLVDAAARATISTMGGDLMYSSRSTMKRLNPTEEAIYRKFMQIPLVGTYLPEPLMDSGWPEIPLAVYTTWKLTPIFGQQFTRPAAAGLAVQRADGFVEGALEGTAALLGLAERKYVDVGRQMDSILYAQQEAYNKIKSNIRVGPTEDTRRDLPSIPE